jgi:uncharacterized protein (TIGR02996 family)
LTRNRWREWGGQKLVTKGAKGAKVCAFGTGTLAGQKLITSAIDVAFLITSFGCRSNWYTSILHSHDDFLRAIDAQPGERTARLVYADWLDVSNSTGMIGVSEL